MRFLRQSLTGLFLLAVTAGLLMVAVQIFSGAVRESLNQEERQRPQRERVFTVNVVTAEAKTISPQISVFGEIQSQRTLELRAATGGTIVEMSDAFQEGGQVTAGDLLIQIDPSKAEDALARAENEIRLSDAEGRDAARALLLAQDELAAANDQQDLREKALERQQDLEARGVGTAAAIETAELNLSAAQQQVLSRRQALAQAESAVDQAATQLSQAQLDLTEAQRALTDLQVRADFDGTLADVTALKGGLVSANERLGQLVDADALEVAFRVSTAQYARLLGRGGQLRNSPVNVALDVSGFVLTAEGRISRDSAAVGEGQTGRLIFATLENARGLKPGDFVSVSVAEAPVENIISLPASSLDTQGRVMVIGDGERLEAVSVELVRRQGDEILVRAEALIGEAVVTRLTPLLGAGIRVRPVSENTPTSTAAAAPEPAAPEMLELSEERRAKLLAFVEANQRMPAERKASILEQLSEPKVPAQVVNRLEQRMGG